SRWDRFPGVRANYSGSIPAGFERNSSGIRELAETGPGQFTGEVRVDCPTGFRRRTRRALRIALPCRRQEDAVAPGSPAAEGPDEDQARTMTLEAFADTIIPGEKRSPDDRAVAGVSAGGGAVAAGAIELLQTPATGISELLGYLAQTLNGHAAAYAAEHGVELDGTVPPFVALPYEHRAGVVQVLTTPGHPEKDGWVLLSLFSNMAFDVAAHRHTLEAMAD